MPVDKEGQYAYSLRPRTEKIMNKLMCDITIKDNVKIVTLRSTYKVENQTLYPVEVAMVDSEGSPVSVEKIGNWHVILTCPDVDGFMKLLAIASRSLLRW